jgi:hypothetical protein
MKKAKINLFFIMGIILILGITLVVFLSKYGISLRPFGLSTIYVAEQYGELDLDNSCIAVLGENNSRYTLVWPLYFEVFVENESVTIFDNYLDQHIAWRDGEMIRVRGEEASQVNKEDTQEIDARCPGPYWIVSGWR